MNSTGNFRIFGIPTILKLYSQKKEENCVCSRCLSLFQRACVCVVGGLPMRVHNLLYRPVCVRKVSVSPFNNEIVQTQSKNLNKSYYISG